MGVERQRTGLKLGSGSEPALELPWWKRGNSSLATTVEVKSYYSLQIWFLSYDLKSLTDEVCSHLATVTTR